MTLRKTSIYAAACYGYYRARVKDDRIEDRCIGMRTRLEFLCDCPPSTRDQNLKAFEVHLERRTPLARNRSGEDVKVHIMVVPEGKDDIEPSINTASDDPAMGMKPSSPLSNLPSASKNATLFYFLGLWRTSVTYMMIRPGDLGDSEARQEKIFALAPLSAPMQITLLGHMKKDGQRRSTRSKSVFDLKGDKEEDDEFVHPGLRSESDDTDPSLLEMDDDDSSSSSEPLKEAIIRFLIQVQSNTKTILIWLFHNLQDDFLNRTIGAGERIVERIPRAAYSTALSLKRLGEIVVKAVLDDEDDDDEDGEDDE